MNYDKAQELIRQSLGEGAFDYQFGDGSGGMVPVALLLKLVEECGELTQAAMKCLNPQSSSSGQLGMVFEEAGHVQYFLDILNALSHKKVGESKKARKTRHALNPKSR